MSPLERWSLHLAALATAGTGLMDGWLRWFGQRAGEFGPEAHPWLPVAQHLHVLTAPLLIFALGMVVRGHLWAQLRKGQGSLGTGLGAAVLIAPMVLSGCGIQVVTDPGWRTVMAWIHGLSASCFLLAYLGHLFLSQALPGSSREPVAEGER